MKILLIGPLPPPIGGTTVSFKCFVDQLKMVDGIRICLINTAGVRENGIKGLFRFGLNVFKIIWMSRKADIISLHSSTWGLFAKALPALLSAKIYKKPLIIRKFGGSDFSESLTGWKLGLSNFVVKEADYFLVETCRLKNIYSKNGFKNIDWLPTHRKISPQEPKAPPKTSKRLAYIGHIRKFKGIEVLAACTRLLPPGIEISVYGPWFDDVDKNIFDGLDNIRYFGELEPEKVIDVIKDHHALVLPTLASTEGYPGSIIESFIAGRPVIATDCGAISELVDEKVGVLIEPNNPEILANAIINLPIEGESYLQLQLNAKEKAKLFSVQTHTINFIALCKKIIERRNT